MKKITTLSLFAFSFISFQGCSKEASQTFTSLSSSATTSETADVCRSRWQGEYVQPSPYAEYFTNDRHIIFNGYAHVPVDGRRVGAFYHTNINLEAPQCSFVNADSLTMDVSLKNPSDSGTSSVASYDVSLFIFGDQDTAHVTFLGFLSDQIYTSIGVGTYQASNLPALIAYFGNYTKVSLVAKDHVLSAYVSGNLRTQINYTGTNIGALKKILIGFKGSGYVSAVQLTNSSTGAIVMQDGFNTPGKSTDTWYQ